jgi:peptidoglycan/LPS O-acetylase OafA/YrhL
MSLHSMLGIISSIVLFIPFILILVLKLLNHRSFLALSVYYLVAGVYNLITQNVIDAPVSFSRPIGIINNLLDAPLMLLFLIFFSTSSLMTRRITASIFIFLAFEAVILTIYGFNVRTVKIVLGPDIAIIVVLSFLFFLRNVRLAITNQKSLGKAVMVSSVLLSYSIFSLVYIFFYLVKDKQYKDDARLVYYLVTLLSAILMSIGIIIENKRIKKLGELKNTRKELATLYGHTKTAALNKDSRFLKTDGF